MYSAVGLRSLLPERLLKASLLMALYTVLSERLFCEQLDEQACSPQLVSDEHFTVDGTLIEALAFAQKLQVQGCETRRSGS
jgi:transposase